MQNQNGLNVWTCLEKYVPTFRMGTWHFIFKLGTLRIEIALFMNCYWTGKIGKINRFVEIKKMPLTHSFFFGTKEVGLTIYFLIYGRIIAYYLAIII